MSEFFQRPPRSGESERPARPTPPPWSGPPDGVLPGVVGVELVLARNERAVVFVGRLGAYPTGVELDVRVLTAGDEWLEPSLHGVYHRPGRPPGDNYEQMLRFGVEFADGRRATNVGGRRSRESEPESPVLWGMGGGGGGSSWQQGFWLWPLPPPGRLSFVCEWPAAGLALSRADIDAQAVIDAAARAQVVFPDQPLRDSGVGWSSTAVQFGSAGTGPGTPPDS